VWVPSRDSGTVSRIDPRFESCRRHHPRWARRGPDRGR
jgi:hypothetical protein